MTLPTSPETPRPLKDPISYPQISELTGVKVTVLRKYLLEARKRRSEGNSTAADIPEPGGYFGNSPAWERKVIVKWIAARPGSGASKR